MEKDLDKMTRSEVNEEMEKFLMESTPKLLSLFIAKMEQSEDDTAVKAFIFAVKSLTFSRMLKALGVNQYQLKVSGRGFETHLHLGEGNDKVLHISKEDSQDENAVCVRLYDQHKDKLLRLLDDQSNAALELEAVVHA